MRKNIPNIITLLNLCFGTVAIYYIFQEDWMIVVLLVGIAGLADFADGLVARALNVSSPIGKELDSLADVVSFGVVPGLVVFKLLLGESQIIWSAIPALLITIAACLRLAKFNTQEDTSGDFIGLSTPAATSLIMGLLLLVEKSGWHQITNTLMEPWALYILSILLALLMTSNLKMFSLKFKGMKWAGNEIRWIFILLFVALSILFQWSSVFLIMVLYILVSIVQNWFFKTA